MRACLALLCNVEGSPWRLLRGDFSPDGHVSIDMGLETTCRSVCVNVEADGACARVWVCARGRHTRVGAHACVCAEVTHVYL